MTDFYYPTRNIVGREPVWQRRRLSNIHRIDLLEHPLPIRDYLRRPLIRRGRWLIRAYDIDLGNFRQFYECGFRHCFREPLLRIGERDDNGKLRPVGDHYAATVADRRMMAMVLHRLKSKDGLFVYADDLRVVRAC